jgi:hypothetical protein
MPALWPWSTSLSRDDNAYADEPKFIQELCALDDDNLRIYGHEEAGKDQERYG